LKRKINGAVYDTEKAELLACWATEASDGHPNERDGLYRTKSGKYFTCELGLDSGNPGYRIYPKSQGEAMRLACRQLGIDAARPLFVSGPEDDSVTKMLRVSGRAWRVIRDIAAERGDSMAAVVDELVNEGEPFGDERVVFDEIAEQERPYEEIRRKAEEFAEGEAS